MRRTIAWTAVAFGLAAAAASTSGIAKDIVEIRLRGHFYAEPATVRITVAVEPAPNHRALLIEADGETVISVQRTQGRMRHTQLEVDLPWAVVWTIKRGKVLRTQGYMSKAHALEAVGLSE